jgi:hypothetical protein
MSPNLRYHRAMRYWMAVFAAALFAVAASAQANGVPPSVTSFGFGGHPGFNGVPPSVTSPGPRGTGNFHAPQQLPAGPGPGHHHHRHDGGYPYYIPYYVPYYVPYYAYSDSYDGPVDPSSADSAENPEQYQGGPTIFDRRGSGSPAPNDYPPASTATVPRPSAPVAATRPAPTPPTPTPSEEILATKAAEPPTPSITAQPSTILVFKDSHRQEVGNYAIVGSNLFDLTPGHRMRIALSDLDLPATQKANEDEGIDFTLPHSPDAN